MDKKKIVYSARMYLFLLMSLFLLFNLSFISGECDPSGCVSNISIIIGDELPPNLIFVSPANNSYYNSNQSIGLNHTETDTSGVDTVWFYVLNSTGSYEISNTTIIGNVTFNVSREGNYTIYLLANDSAGNVVSISHFFIVDLTDPNISIISPLNGYTISNYVSGSIAIPVNVSVNDTNLDSCKYSVAGSQVISNTSFACSKGYNSFAFALSTAGSFVVSVYSNDSAGNENLDKINMSILAYTGPQQGGGETNNPGQGVEEDLTNYNVTIMCNRVGQFLDTHNNYTFEEKEALKNILAIELGLAINDQILNKYLSEFKTRCPDYVTPEIPGEEPVEKKKSTWIWWVIGGILLLILILFIVFDLNEYFEVIFAKIKSQSSEK